MLVETITALAAASGAAVVQAAGTDAWNGLRTRAGRMLSRGDSAREQAELARLDLTAEALTSHDAVDTAAVRLRHEGVWQGRFEGLLQSIDGPELARTADELRELLAFVAAATGDVAIGTGKAVALDGGSAVSGVKRVGSSLPGPAKVLNTGDAEATGTGSSAVSGIVNQ
ncbi:hypothetical protein ACFYRY_24375 [Streptomyces sp. NPDC005263]|uniref:hypothetical protein n=1 Tax=Streptomyces sp. NPDC005263 TaxID=3364711 RepID=UPI0036C58A9F